MASGSIITATRYNQIQATVSSVLGTGAADSGYGQQLTSSQVSPTETITALHMNRLRTDMLTAFVHQTGTNTGFTLPTVTAGTDVVSASTTQGNNEYESYPILANTLQTNRNSFTTLSRSTNFTLEPNIIVSSRSTPWGGSQQSQSVFHEVTVQFVNANARRHYFNTGSEIRFRASLNNFPGGAGQAKFDNWSGMFSGMGTIIFSSFATTNTGSGTSQPIGNFSLTSSEQIIFIKAGSDLYSDNTYIIKAKSVDTRTISFLIEFNDLYTGTGDPSFPGSGIDEPVEGTLTSRVDQYRATGTTISGISKVTVPAPVYQNIKTV